MKLTLTIVILGSSWTANAGEWTRIDQKTIKLEGKIEANEYGKFEAVVDPLVKHLIVNSGGGETSAAIEIGKQIRADGISVEVQNWCLSSCANYLFVGGIKRKINKGIVGFHGNVQACFGGKKWPEVIQQLKDQGLSEKEIKAFHVHILNQITAEQKFFKSIGVSQELFDRSCLPDKGMSDGKEYAFLLPLPESFEKYGLTKIDGSQDLQIAKDFPGPLAVQ